MAIKISIRMGGDVQNRWVSLSLKSRGDKQEGLMTVSGDIQDPPGQGPVQPAVGDPALAGGLD